MQITMPSYDETEDISEQDFIDALYDLDSDLLTTLDNPYNPKKDYEHWLNYDHTYGYYTAEYIVRIAGFSPHDDDYTTSVKYSRALNFILNNDHEGVYKLV